MTEPIVYKYDPAHPGDSFPGVPQRDLTQADVDALAGDARRHVLSPAVRPTYVPVEAKAPAAPKKPGAPKKAKTPKVATDAPTDQEPQTPADDADDAPAGDGGEAKDGAE